MINNKSESCTRRPTFCPGIHATIISWCAFKKIASTENALVICIYRPRAIASDNRGNEHCFYCCIVHADYGQLAPKTTRPKTTRPKENSPQDNSPHIQKTTRPIQKTTRPTFRRQLAPPHS